MDEVCITFETSEISFLSEIQETFNPHFTSMTFETLRRFMTQKLGLAFNPHFLSIAFELRILEEEV